MTIPDRRFLIRSSSQQFAIGCLCLLAGLGLGQERSFQGRIYKISIVIIIIVIYICWPCSTSLLFSSPGRRRSSSTNKLQHSQPSPEDTASRRAPRSFRETKAKRGRLSVCPEVRKCFSIASGSTRLHMYVYAPVSLVVGKRFILAFFVALWVVQSREGARPRAARLCATREYVKLGSPECNNGLYLSTMYKESKSGKWAVFLVAALR